MKNLKKLLLVLLVFCGLSIINSIQANAAWRQNSTGWWYTDGNSWVTGWKNINNEWYYFDSTGYMKTGWIYDNGNWFYTYSNGTMASNTKINGYYLNSNGAWSNPLSLKECSKIVMDKVKSIRHSNDSRKLCIVYEPKEVTIEGKDGYFIRVSVDLPDHIFTPNNIFIDKYTGEVFDAGELFLIMGDCKLQKLEKTNSSGALTDEGIINANNNPLYK
ncbi:hypothetical protein FDG50_05855 [Clostridium botulinum]|uniref:hypothetical protein n=1 Tax=Clostridium botulinum TaxID=1491 RepID=UPI0013FFFA67|nr:hypothetical protein [Clostridium botulinum]MBY6836825.1 hypothetical protein [Clostridium botulinum]NFG64118.1 hypothetical protein [Clostridium botulinum]NFQ23662.1 hypothetical protein [Clostridium botulinum]